VAGGDRVVVRENEVLDNRPSGDTFVEGGIVVVTSDTPDLGGDDPNHNLIARNVAFDNEPFDIFWDETGVGNRFRNNECGTSSPSEICD
jgi:hypothetical protein